MWRERLYDEAAYLARYGKIQPGAIGKLTSTERRDWTAALSRLVKREEGK